MDQPVIWQHWATMAQDAEAKSKKGPTPLDELMKGM